MAVENHQGSAVNQAYYDTVFDGLFYRAVDNARKFAERRHDFSQALVSVSFTLAAGGSVNLSSLLGDDAITYNIRAPKTLYNATSGNLIRVPLRTRDAIANRNQMRRLITGSAGYEVSGSLFGKTLSLEPALIEDVPMVVDGYKYFDDVPTDDDTHTDWFIQYAFDFLQWGCVVELNHLNQVFIPRQEGSLDAPTRARDLALESLIIDDVYAQEAYTDTDLL